MSEATESDNLPRPTAFTAEAQAMIVDAIARGNYLSTACARAGVTYSAFAYWRKLYEAGNAQEFADFFEAVKKASAAAECNALESLKEGEPGWQAKAWFLERRFRKRWGHESKVKQEVSGPKGGPVPVNPVTFYIPDNGRDGRTQGDPPATGAPGAIPD